MLWLGSKMKKFSLFFKSSGNIHRESGGQAMLFVALGVFVLISFFALTINIGHLTSTKIEMQNAADASVLSGSLWQARGLNMISILNVGMTESLALIVMFKAFDDTLTFAEDTLEANIAAANAAVPPDTDLIECLETYGGQDPLAVLDDLNKKLKPFYEAEEILWELMNDIHFVQNNVELAVRQRAPLEASEIAEANGAGTMYNNGSAFVNAAYLPDDDLPVEDGTIEDICKPAWNGGSGYSNYLCRDNAYDIKIFNEKLKDAIYGLWGTPTCLDPSPASVWENFIALNHNQLCSGDTSGRPFPLIMQEDFMNRLYFTSVVRKNNRTGFPLLGSGSDPIVSFNNKKTDEDITFGDEGNSVDMGKIALPKETWGVAAAQVYNPDPDLFNQNWHTRLTPVNVSLSIAQHNAANVAIPLPDNIQNVIDSAPMDVRDTKLMVH